ncbi:MAG: glycosyltransferase family 4 protein [Planctomycetia bacterium]|nr:glycosyltransferase family 4 protein [Planctomycetia bacterium]
MFKILIWESLSILAGGQKVALQIASALGGKYECVFFIPNDGPLALELEKRNIKYHILNIGQYSVGEKKVSDILKYFLKTPKIFVHAYKLIRQEKIQLIYVNAARNFMWSALLGKLMSIPVMWHVHNYFQDNKTKFLIRSMGRFKSVKKIVFVANSVKKQFPALEAKSTVVFNGIETDKFLLINSKVSQIRSEFKIPDFKRIVISIGWLMPTKRQDILLKAVPLILSQIRDVHFIFVGGKREGYESYYNELLDMVHDMGIEDHVTFTGHRVDVPEILKDSCINIITSEEAFPFTLLEGWASGVPTIGPDYGSIPELIEDNKTGLIYDHTSPNDLSEKIIDLLKDKQKYEKIKGCALGNSKKYDIAQFNKNICSLIDEVLIS